MMAVEQVLEREVVEFAERWVGLLPARGSGGERVLVRLQRLQARLGR
jgi:hypothetical protein